MGTRGRASVVPMVSPTRPPGYPKYPRLHRLSERHHRVGPYRRRCGRNPVTANVSRGLAVWQWRPESGKSQLQGPRRTLAQDSGCERVCRPDPPAPTTDRMTARYGPQRAASCRRARSQSRSERGGEAHPFASRVGWQLRGRCVVWRRDVSASRWSSVSLICTSEDDCARRAEPMWVRRIVRECSGDRAAADR